MSVRVLVVDDSAVVRQVMSDILGSTPGMEVMVANDPIFAMQKMQASWPDVIVLDIEMPRMDGLTFLRKVMAERPTPVVICSSLTEKGASTSLEAMAAGAVEVVPKPKAGVKGFLEESAAELVRTVRAAASAKVHRRAAPAAGSELLGNRPKHTADVVLPPPTGALTETTERIVAIGTSTGGTQALEEVLTRLPRVCPGIVIVQHMPEKFTAAFAKRLNDLCEIEVREAVQGDRVIPGRAIIAPGGKHLVLKRSGAYYHVDVVDGPVVNRHKPSVDVLFRSVAKYAGRNATGIILTGMGDDGARGMKEMHESGARTLAQDEASCVVFGMPKEAIKLGGVDEVISLAQVPSAILKGGVRF